LSTDNPGNGVLPVEIRHDLNVGMNVNREQYEALRDNRHEIDPPNSTMADGSISREYDIETLVTDDRTVNSQAYNYLSSLTGAIGGVSTGPVTLWLRDDPSIENSGKRVVHAARKYYKVSGGQAYMPMLMMLFEKKETSEKAEKHANLPMLLTRILMNEPGNFDSDKNKLFNEFIEGSEVVDDKVHSFWRNNKIRPGLGVRFEFYKQDDLIHIDTRMELPKFQYATSVRWSRKSEIMDPMAELGIAHSRLLQDVADDLKTALKEPGRNGHPISAKSEHLSTELKTAYVYTAERLCSLVFDTASIGKITRLMNRERNNGGTNLFPSVPEDCRIPLPVLRDPQGRLCDPQSVPLDPETADGEYYEDHMGTQLPYGIPGRFLALPGNENEDDFITYRDLRKNTAYLQRLGGSIFRELTLPKLYYLSIGSITKHLFLAVNSTGDLTETGIFDRPSYNEIAKISKQDRELLFTKLARLLCKCYHTEWWWLVRERMWCLYRQFPNLPRDLRTRPIDDVTKFPRTCSEYSRWKDEVPKDDYVVVLPSRSLTTHEIDVSSTSDIISLVSKNEWTITASPRPLTNCRSNHH
jgi:hypothetical protein